MRKPTQVGFYATSSVAESPLVTDNFSKSSKSGLIIFETVTNKNLCESKITYVAFSFSRCAYKTKKEEQEQDQHLKFVSNMFGNENLHIHHRNIVVSELFVFRYTDHLKDRILSRNIWNNFSCIYSIAKFGSSGNA